MTPELLEILRLHLLHYDGPDDAILTKLSTLKELAVRVQQAEEEVDYLRALITCDEREPLARPKDFIL